MSDFERDVERKLCAIADAVNWGDQRLKEITAILRAQFPLSAIHFTETEMSGALTGVGTPVGTGTFTTTPGKTLSFQAVPVNSDGTPPEVTITPAGGATVTVGSINGNGVYVPTIGPLSQGPALVQVSGDNIGDCWFVVDPEPPPPEGFTVDPTTVTFQ